MSEAVREVVRGDGCTIDADATVGYGEFDEPTRIGEEATIRAGSIVYGDVTIGNGFATGHDVLVREGRRSVTALLVGTKTVIDGQTTIGSHVSLQTNVYVPTETTIGNNVFVGPGAVLTNDEYPVRTDDGLEGRRSGRRVDRCERDAVAQRHDRRERVRRRRGRGDGRRPCR